MSGLLLHSPADIAAQALIDSGLGVEVDGSATPWQTYVDVEGYTPDEVIAVKNTQGRENGRGMVTGQVSRFHGVQLVIRSRKSEVGAMKAEAIKHALETAIYGMNVTVPATDEVPQATYRITCFNLIGDVLPVGYESGSSRFIHTINPTLVVRML